MKKDTQSLVLINGRVWARQRKLLMGSSNAQHFRDLKTLDIQEVSLSTKKRPH